MTDKTLNWESRYDTPNIGSFVIVSGITFHVETVVDDNGFFFATNDDGGEFEFHVDSVDHIDNF